MEATLADLGNTSQLRNDRLDTTDPKVASDSDAIKQSWIEFRQKLRDIPVTWKKGEQMNIPHMVKFPDEPVLEDMLNPSRRWRWNRIIGE